MRVPSERRHLVEILLAVGVCAVSRMASLASDETARRIVAVTPAEVRWFTPSYYTDGRQRAQLIPQLAEPRECDAHRRGVARG